MKFAYLIEPPFNYRDADGTLTGCDVELARHVASALGGDPFEPVETEFADLLPGVAQGRWRMTTGLFDTGERRRLVAFSRPVWALPDGLLVRRGNPHRLDGYRSASERPACRLAVIRDQIQHRSALELGIPERRILVFDTYAEAARSVRDGETDAYASVGRAHSAFIAQNPDTGLEVVPVPAAEKEPAFGAFAFGKSDDAFRRSVDEILDRYIGGAAHRGMMKRYGFAQEEIDLLLR